MGTSIPEESGARRNATEALLLTPEQASESLAICRTKVYELLRRGELESVCIGTSRRIPRAAVAEFVQRLRQRAEENCGPQGCAGDRSPTSAGS